MQICFDPIISDYVTFNLLPVQSNKENICGNIEIKSEMYNGKFLLDVTAVTSVHLVDLVQRISALNCFHRLVMIKYLERIQKDAPQIKFRKMAKRVDQFKPALTMTIRYRDCSLDIANRLQLFNKIRTLNPASTPYFLITTVVSNFLKTFINNSLYSAFRVKAITRQDLKTSCVLTSKALASLFWGQQEAEKITDEFSKYLSIKLLPKYPDGSSASPIEIFGLVEGRLMFRLQKLIEGYQFDAFDIQKIRNKLWCQLSNEYIELIAGRVVDHLLKTGKKSSFTEANVLWNQYISNKNTVTDEALLETWKTVLNTEPFNALVIHDLRNEAIANIPKISDSQSFGYYCRINAPTTKGSVTHAFIIEQFMHLSGVVGYRMYQSWIGQGTLLDDLDKKRYNTLGDNAMTMEEFHLFLNRLDIFLSPGPNRKEALTHCFGYEGEVKDLIKEKDGFVYSGFRFIAKSFNPAHTYQHLNDILFNYKYR